MTGLICWCELAELCETKKKKKKKKKSGHFSEKEKKKKASTKATSRTGKVAYHTSCSY